MRRPPPRCKRSAPSIPVDWRRAEVEREDLPQFLFGPEDVVAVVGRDGLVANVAKYVGQQPVVGFNPFPDAQRRGADAL